MENMHLGSCLIGFGAGETGMETHEKYHCRSSLFQCFKTAETTGDQKHISVFSVEHTQKDT